MGNYRFKLSDMISNSWFYKLNKPRNHNQFTNPTTQKHTFSSSLSSSSSSSVPIPTMIQQQPHPSDQSGQRKSYYFTRDLTTFQPNSPIKTKNSPAELPRKSSRRRRSTKRNRVVSTSISAGCSCRATLESVWAKPPDSSSDHDSALTEYGGSDRGLTPDTFDGILSVSSTCKCRTEKNDIVFNVDHKSFNCDNSRVSQLDHLPPIITKKQSPAREFQKNSAEFEERNTYNYKSLSVNIIKEDFLTAPIPVRRLSSSSGVKLRTNSPKIANRRIQGGGRKSTSSNSSSGTRRRSVSETLAVVKSSKDPRRDFMESMVEMIVENNITASKDLEELLACYLSLNSDEYHELIINVFKQIWFDFVGHVRLN